MLRIGLLAYLKNSTIIDDFFARGFDWLFLSRTSVSEFLTYAKYAADSLPCLSQNFLVH